MFWIKLLAALCLFIVGFAAAKPFGFWIQDQLVRNTSGVDERAALVSAAFSSVLIAVAAIPFSTLIFLKLGNKKKKRETLSRKEAESLDSDIVALGSSFRSATTLPLQVTTNQSDPRLTRHDERELAGGDSAIATKQVEILLDYDQVAADAWVRVQEMPTKYQNLFLQSLDQDIEQNVEDLLVRIMEERQKELRPFAQEEANLALEQARTISAEAADEFIVVFSLLGSKVRPEVILQKIEARFGPAEETLRRLEAERLEAERLEAERLEAERLEEELRVAAWIKKERLEEEARRSLLAAATEAAAKEKSEARRLLNEELQREDARRKKRAKYFWGLLLMLTLLFFYVWA